MNIKCSEFSPELLCGLKHVEVRTERAQDKLEVRLLTAFVTWYYLIELYGLATYTLQLSPSMLHKVAGLSSNPEAIGYAFVIAFVLLVPHAVCLAFFPRYLYVRWPRKLATFAAASTMSLWAYLAVLALPLDVSVPVVRLYILNAMQAGALAFLFAFSLNSQLLRSLVHQKKDLRDEA